MKRITLAVIMAVCSGMLHAQYSYSPQQEYFMRELRDANMGQFYYAYNYPKANTIYNQLRNYTGMQFPVLFLQTFNWGQAHNGGLIFIDYSMLNKSASILAFTMAHEWGHEALGHAANIYRPNGSGLKYYASQKDKEDEADEYAGKFLKKYGYILGVVTSYLRSVPNMGDDQHSTGPERAQTIIDAYNGDSDDDPPSPAPATRSPQRRLVSCTHPAHPSGDISACTHAAHYNGDVYPCAHTCQGPYGYVRCHPNGDVGPCNHPMHPRGDVSQCEHSAHPAGDYVYE